MVGGAAHPIDERLVGIVGHLGSAGEVEVGVIGIEVLADHVHVVETVEQQAAGPIRGTEIIGDQFAAESK